MPGHARLKCDESAWQPRERRWPPQAGGRCCRTPQLRACSRPGYPVGGEADSASLVPSNARRGRLRFKASSIFAGAVLPDPMVSPRRHDQFGFRRGLQHPLHIPFPHLRRFRPGRLQVCRIGRSEGREVSPRTTAPYPHDLANPMHRLIVGSSSVSSAVDGFSIMNITALSDDPTGRVNWYRYNPSLEISASGFRRLRVIPLLISVDLFPVVVTGNGVRFPD